MKLKRNIKVVFIAAAISISALGVAREGRADSARGRNDDHAVNELLTISIAICGNYMSNNCVGQIFNTLVDNLVNGSPAVITLPGVPLSGLGNSEDPITSPEDLVNAQNDADSIGSQSVF
jgi:hypothetical protein